MYKLKNEMVWWDGNSGGLPYEKAMDACQKIWIKPLMETNLGVAQASFWSLIDDT